MFCILHLLFVSKSTWDKRTGNTKHSPAAVYSHFLNILVPYLCLDVEDYVTGQEDRNGKMLGPHRKALPHDN